MEWCGRRFRRRGEALPGAFSGLALAILSATASAEPPREVDSRPPAFHRVPIAAAGFSEVKLWVPEGPVRSALPALVLLHGNQSIVDDPAWLVGLGSHPLFRRRVLVVPALRDDYRWDRATTARAVVSLVDRVARTYPVARQRVLLLGHSAGGSRVLAVAAAAPEVFSGFIAVAGDIGRSLRRSSLQVRGLVRKPVLLVCMTGDRGPNASCALDRRNRELLVERGFTDVVIQPIEGGHGFDVSRVAPVLDRWIAAHANRQ